ncbi:hypothetical protein HanRHA438_Chr05g0212971 [Helianthus annuus]|nr:hypothetical protein HanRHA438_Chr05g0212971 [Helianthus annuus]
MCVFIRKKVIFKINMMGQLIKKESEHLQNQLDGPLYSNSVKCQFTKDASCMTHYSLASTISFVDALYDISCVLFL